jgi:hypothetical protein
MNRRSLLAAMAGLPFLGFLRPREVMAKNCTGQPIAKGSPVMVIYNGVELEITHVQSIKSVPIYSSDGYRYLWTKVDIAVEGRVP